jgi:hypothetical protein
MYATAYTETTDISGSTLSIYPYQEYTNRATNPFKYVDLTEQYRLYQLKGCMIVTYPFINTFEGSYPYNSLDFSEIGIVELSTLNPITGNVDCILENRLYETYNITNPNATFKPLVSIPYKTYTTCISSYYDRLYSREVSEFSNSSVSYHLNYPDQSVICIEMASNIDFQTGANNNQYLVYNDVYINDSTLQNNTTILIDYCTERSINYSEDGNIPFTVDSTGQESKRKTTAFAKMTREPQLFYHPQMADVFVNSIVDVSSTGEIVSSMGNVVLRHGYGIYHQYTNANGEIAYSRYSDAEGVGKNYVVATSTIEKEHYVCYATYNTLSEIENGNVLPRYKFTKVSQVANVARNIILRTSDLPSPVTSDMNDQFVLVNKETPELYKCIAGTWTSQILSDYYGSSFIVDSSSSFYHRNVYVLDSEDMQFVPVYESEVYRDSLYYEQFLYDKVDIEVIVTDSLSFESNAQYFPRHSKVAVRKYTSDYSKSTSARFYIVQGIVGSPASSNYFVEYTVPTKVTIKSRYSGRTGSTKIYSGGAVTYTRIDRVFYYETQRILQISPSVMSENFSSTTIQDVIQNETIQYTGKDGNMLDTYMFADSNTRYTTDITAPNGSSFYYATQDATTGKLFYKHIVGVIGEITQYDISGPADIGPDSEYTFGVSSYLFGRRGLTFSASQTANKTVQPVYPTQADFAVFDIVSDSQFDELKQECIKYPTLLDDTELVATYDCNLYQYVRSTSSFIAYDSSLLLGKTIYVYGTFSGNRGKLFRRISNTIPLITTAQCYADYHIADLLKITNDASYNELILSHVTANQIARYELLIVYRPIESDLRYTLYRVDGSGIPQQVSNSSSVFPSNNHTFFINGTRSELRGCNYRLHSTKELHQVVVTKTDNLLPIYYPENTRIVSLSNPLRDYSTASEIQSNQLSTQPFLSGNQWYTKVFYRGGTRNLTPSTNVNGTERRIFSNITQANYKEGGENCFETYESHQLFFSGMKGMRIPFINISPRTSSSANTIGTVAGSFYYGKVSDYCVPVPSDYLTTENPISEDYSPYLTNDRTLRKIFGSFQRGSTDWDYTDTEYRFRESATEECEYPYVIVPGFYMGYGGRIQERHEEEYVNSIVNNDKGLRVSRISQVGGKQYIYAQLPVQHAELFERSRTDAESKLSIRGRNRLSTLPYDMQFEYVDQLFQNPDYLDGLVSIFGTGGRIVKKRINSPYQLNPNNYVFLVIPNLNHIDNVQNTLFSDTDGAFAKVLLPGDSNRVVYKSHVGGSKVYYDMLFNNLSELEVAFVTNKGTLFDFNGAEHSFTLEITEFIDKIEYINPRTGNIEYPYR